MQLSISSKEELKDSCLQNLRAVANDMATLQSDRLESFDAYLAKPYGNELEGRSKFVTSDLSDVVESIMPSLMRTFYGNKNVVSVQPVGVEDEKAADLMEELVNWQFTTQMNGYAILDTWFRDSLYQKMGVVKFYWLEDKEYKTKEYEGMTEAEYMNVLAQVDAGTFIIDKEESVTEEEAEYDDYGMTVKPSTVSYNVEGRKITKISRPCVENIPPEELVFDIQSKNIETCLFIAHKKRVHKTYLLKYNVKDVDIATEVDSFNQDMEYQNRFADLGGISFFQDHENPDYVYIYECYLDYYDKKGKKTPMKVVVMGNQVIDCEENKYGKAPFCVLTPITVPHRMIGRDFADLVKPIQELHSMYVRYINDNLAFQNNGMRIVDPFKLNMSDVLEVNRPGGTWRLKQPGNPALAVHNLTPTPLAPEVYGLIEKMEMMRQERTGITKYNSGMDSKSLNRTATGISQIMNAANQRIELLARGYAETGVKRLFQALVDMNLDFFDNEVNIKVNKDWAQITPDMIDGSFDIVVDVGASIGTNELKTNQMMQMLNTYGASAQMGAPVPAKYIYNIQREIWSLWGYKNVDMFAPAAEQVPKDMVEQLRTQKQVQQQVGQGAPDPAQQAMMGLQVEKLLAEIMKLRTEGIKNLATAEAAEVGTQIETYTAEMQALVPQQGQQQPSQQPVQARAKGGHVQSGQPYLVGEQGPELMIPSEDGAVIPATTTEQILKSQGHGYGLRPDGTSKGTGWLGAIPMYNGKDVMTELTAEADGMAFPLIVPTLTKEEIDHLARGGRATDQIFGKAISHAKMRMEQGFSPYKD